MAGTGDNMKNDHQYAEVLEMMRSQGAKDNPKKSDCCRVSWLQK